MHSFVQIKHDAASMAAEIVALGGTKSGGLARAGVEFWLEPDVLADALPTPLEVKFAAALSICSLRSEAGLPAEPEDQMLIRDLLSLIDAQSLVKSFSASDARAMQEVARATLEQDLSYAVNALFATAAA
jgi:hypothetical protein